jgi:hypothetical protein
VLDYRPRKDAIHCAMSDLSLSRDAEEDVDTERIPRPSLRHVVASSQERLIALSPNPDGTKAVVANKAELKVLDVNSYGISTSLDICQGNRLSRLTAFKTVKWGHGRESDRLMALFTHMELQRAIPRCSAVKVTAL